VSFCLYPHYALTSCLSPSQIRVGCDGLAAQRLAAPQQPGPPHRLHDAGVFRVCRVLSAFVTLCRRRSRRGAASIASCQSLATTTAVLAVSTYNLRRNYGTKLKAVRNVMAFEHCFFSASVHP